MPSLDHAITKAVQILRDGGLVGFPTETVYGVGADVGNDRAVQQIYHVKRRPTGHPLIVHLAGASAITRYAQDIPAAAWQLAEVFWPGPMTLVLKAAAHTSRVATGGQDTVGLRVPSHPLAQALLGVFGGGIAAPSANRFGQLSPTRAEHVREELGGDIDFILDGGSCEVGLESTIVDLSGDQVHILRPGGVTRAQIEAVLGKPTGNASRNAPRVPGSHASHYAPRTPLTVLPRQQLLQHLLSPEATTARYAIVSLDLPPPCFDGARWKVMASTYHDYGKQLFATLRELDKLQCEQILVELPPSTPEWAAVHDRLARAAARGQ